MNKKLIIGGIIGFVTLVVLFALSVQNKRDQEDLMDKTIFTHSFINYLLEVHPEMTKNSLYEDSAKDSLLSDFTKFVGEKQDTINVTVDCMNVREDKVEVMLGKLDVFAMNGFVNTVNIKMFVLMDKSEATKLTEGKSYLIKIDKVLGEHLSIVYSTNLNTTDRFIDVELCIEQNVPFIVVNHGEVNLFSAGITKQELIKLAYD